MFFSDDLYCLRLQSVQYDLQHDFAWVADAADCLVVLALVQVAFLGKCDDRGLDPQGWPFSCLSDLLTDCRDSSDYILSTCLFHSGQVFHGLVCPLIVVLPQIFFNLTTLFSYPFFFS